MLRVSGNALDNSIEEFDPISLTIASSTDKIPSTITFSPSLDGAILEQSYKLNDLSNLGLSGLDIDNTSISNKIRLYSDNDSRLSCTINITNWSLQNDGGGLIGASGSTTLSIGIRCIASDVEYSYNIAQLFISGDKSGATFDNEIKGQPGTTSKDIEVPFETICEKAKADNAALYLIVKCDKGINVGTLTISITSDNINSNTRHLTGFSFKAKQIITNMPNVNITKDHFRYLVDDYNYFDINNNGHLTYFFNDGVYGIGTDNGDGSDDDTKTGLWIKIGDNKFYITELNSTIKDAAKAAEEAKGSYTTVASEYNNLNKIINGDGTASNPGLVSRTEGVEVLMYGEGGDSSNPTDESLVKRTETTATSLTTLESNAIVKDGTGTNSFSTVFNNAATNAGVVTSSNFGSNLTRDKNFTNLNTTANDAKSVATSAQTAAAAANTAATQAKTAAANAQSTADTASASVSALAAKAITTDNVESVIETSSSLTAKLSGYQLSSNVSITFISLSSVLLGTISLATYTSSTKTISQKDFSKKVGTTATDGNYEFKSSFSGGTTTTTFNIYTSADAIIIPELNLTNYIVRPVVTADLLNSNYSGTGAYLPSQSSFNATAKDILFEVTKKADGNKKYFTESVIVNKMINV